MCGEALGCVGCGGLEWELRGLPAWWDGSRGGWRPCSEVVGFRREGGAVWSGCLDGGSDVGVVLVCLFGAFVCTVV